MRSSILAIARTLRSIFGISLGRKLAGVLVTHGKRVEVTRFFVTHPIGWAMPVCATMPVCADPRVVAHGQRAASQEVLGLLRLRLGWRLAGAGSASVRES